MKIYTELRKRSPPLTLPVMFQLSLTTYKAVTQQTVTENINKPKGYLPLSAFFCPFPCSVRGAVRLNLKKKCLQRSAPCAAVPLSVPSWKQRKRRNEFQPLRRYLNPCESGSTLLQATVIRMNHRHDNKLTAASAHSAGSYVSRTSK